MAKKSAIQEPPELYDNTAAGLQALLKSNRWYRENAWPAPFSSTDHLVHRGDARNLSWLSDESVHLVVTSPPYWTLKEYESGNGNQLGDIEDYELFLDELDKSWAECARVLVGGGRICCVVGDVCVSRKKGGRHYVMPLHADIQVRARKLGLDVLTPIIWQKIANGTTEASRSGSGFYGKPYQPGGVIKNDNEYILFLRKGGEYRTVSQRQKELSMLSREELQSWFRPMWTDVKGASTRNGHPAPYPVELAERLIRMFSFAGDTVLDPFMGTASTNVAALQAGRNSVGNEVERNYFEMAKERLTRIAMQPRMLGATEATIRDNSIQTARRVRKSIQREAVQA